MSEKRFVQCEIEYGFANTTNIKEIDGIYDMQEEKTYRIEQIVDLLNEQQSTIQSLKEENRKLRNIHLSIDLTYSYGFGRYLTDVRVIDDE